MDRDLQTEIYNFIVHFMEIHQYAPSVREIADGLDIHSTNTVNYHKRKLRERGLIDYKPVISRSIVII